MSKRNVIITRSDAMPHMFTACRQDYDLGDEMGTGETAIDALAALLYWEALRGHELETFTVEVRP